MDDYYKSRMLELNARALRAESRAEKAEAERDAWRGAFETAESILWMAEQYAQGGGSHGVEIEDYRAAREQINVLAAKVRR